MPFFPPQTLLALMWIISFRIHIYCRITYIQAAQMHPDHKIIPVGFHVQLTFLGMHMWDFFGISG